MDFGTIAVVKKFPAYNWSVQEYIRTVENSSNPLIRDYEQAEID